MNKIFVVTALLLITSSPVMAQEDVVAPNPYQLTEPTQEILPLRRGAAAPRDGLLIDAADLLQIRADYERLRYLLQRTTERDEEVCSVRVQIEQARTSACEERLRLRDELWAARQTELAALVTEARAQAQHAAERQWFESPPLWVAVGVALATIVYVAVTVR